VVSRRHRWTRKKQLRYQCPRNQICLVRITLINCLDVLEYPSGKAITSLNTAVFNGASVKHFSIPCISTASYPMYRQQKAACMSADRTIYAVDRHSSAKRCRRFMARPHYCRGVATLGQCSEDLYSPDQIQPVA